jgi:hypothetical protein
MKAKVVSPAVCSLAAWEPSATVDPRNVSNENSICASRDGAARNVSVRMANLLDCSFSNLGDVK